MVQVSAINLASTSTMSLARNLQCSADRKMLAACSVTQECGSGNFMASFRASRSCGCPFGVPLLGCLFLSSSPPILTPFLLFPSLHSPSLSSQLHTLTTHHSSHTTHRTTPTPHHRCPPAPAALALMTDVQVHVTLRRGTTDVKLWLIMNRHLVVERVHGSEAKSSLQIGDKLFCANDRVIVDGIVLQLHQTTMLQWTFEWGGIVASRGMASRGIAFGGAGSSTLEELQRGALATSRKRDTSW